MRRFGLEAAVKDRTDVSAEHIIHVDPYPLIAADDQREGRCRIERIGVDVRQQMRARDLDCDFDDGAVLERPVKVDLLQTEATETWSYVLHTIRVGNGLLRRAGALYEPDRDPVTAVFRMQRPLQCGDLWRFHSRRS